LNQIISTIGFKTFFDGCKAYFKKFAWDNTTLDDFISCLNEEMKAAGKSEFDLTVFSTFWLKHSGCNRIDPELKFDEGKGKYTLEIKQSELNKFENSKEVIRP